MIIGLPKEIKAQEYRIALSPQAVSALCLQGHHVWVEKNAALSAGFKNEDYQKCGAQIISSAQKIWQQADMIVKVKEALGPELNLLRPGLILFTYLHLASQPLLAKALINNNVHAIGYETVQNKNGELVLLKPMSQVAGKLSVLLGADFLRKERGKKGVLLSSLTGAKNGRVLILGAGNVGQAALETALGLGAEVLILDQFQSKLDQIQKQFSSSKCRSEVFNSSLLKEEIQKTDLLIGAVLMAGARAPKLVSKMMIASMEKYSVIVDVSIDQGACVEGIKPTTHAQPIYEYKNILHYAVPNMPSLVAKSSSEALSSAIFPYVEKLANNHLEALRQDSGFASGLQISQGKILHPAVKKSLKN